MTLNQWKKKYDIYVQGGVGVNGKGKVVADGPRTRAREDLFHLSDYLVSGVHGGSIWLMPRPKHMRKNPRGRKALKLASYYRSLPADERRREIDAARTTLAWAETTANRKKAERHLRRLINARNPRRRYSRSYRRTRRNSGRKVYTAAQAKKGWVVETVGGYSRDIPTGNVYKIDGRREPNKIIAWKAYRQGKTFLHPTTRVIKRDAKYDWGGF